MTDCDETGEFSKLLKMVPDNKLVPIIGFATKKGDKLILSDLKVYIPTEELDELTIRRMVVG